MRNKIFKKVAHITYMHGADPGLLGVGWGPNPSRGGSLSTFYVFFPFVPKGRFKRTTRTHPRTANAMLLAHSCLNNYAGLIKLS